MRSMLLICVMALGCGGGKKGGDTTPSGDSVVGMQETKYDSSGTGAGMIPPEKMDEVDRMFRRKDPVISRCLAIAVDNKEVPKSTHGKVGVEVVIGTAGKAESVKITRSDIQAQTVQDCVIGHVKEISFPELPRTYETSHTYVMETM
jgi:hypothetical protein